MLVPFIKWWRSHIIGSIKFNKEAFRFSHTIYHNILERKFSPFTKPILRLCLTHFLWSSQSRAIFTFIQIISARYPVYKTSCPMLTYYFSIRVILAKEMKNDSIPERSFSKSTSLLKLENL